jgi:hypothetical protein
MSLVYHQGFDENGNVIAPQFFTDAMSDMAGTFNGSLDRDNFAQADIRLGDVSGFLEEVFVRFHETASVAGPDMTVTEWQPVGAVEFTALQDGHYDYHGAWAWQWDGSYSHVPVGARPDRTDTYDTLMLRLSADGMVILVAGPFEDGAKKWATYLCGSIQLPAGFHRFEVACMVARRIAQNGQVDGVCTNAITSISGDDVIIQRIR